MKFLRFGLLFLLAGMSLFTGCARYRAQPIKKAVLQPAKLHEKRPVVFAYHVFTRQDCLQYFDRNILKRGYQPILITFTNNTKRYFRVNRESISLPTVPAAQVARKVHTSTLGRALGYGLAGIIVWPLLVPAVVDGVGSSQANRKLDQDFENKELTEHVVGPYSTLSRVIFVPKKDFKWNFTFTFSDAATDCSCTLSSDYHTAGGAL